MKKILIVVIIVILTISLAGCYNKFKEKSVINSEDNVTQAEEKAKNDKSSEENKSSNNNKLIDEKIAIADATNINIEICAAEVSINSYEGDEVKITGKLSDNSEGMVVNKNGNKIEIVEKGYKIIGSIINIGDNNSKINILVPSKFKGNFVFKQGAGASDIEGIKVENIDITGGAGEIKCRDIRFDKLNLNSAVGEVDLNLTEKCGDILINGGVGEVNITMAAVGGNLIYKGSVGSGNITIPKDSPVRFATQNGVGKCEIKAKTSGKETYTFDLKVGVGSISVRN